MYYVCIPDPLLFVGGIDEKYVHDKIQYFRSSTKHKKTRLSEVYRQNKKMFCCRGKTKLQPATFL